MFILIAIYATAMTLANLSIAHFGPWVSPINSFLFIGLDLALRDWLHTKMKAWQMGLLIAASGLLTHALNPAAGAIAVASAVSFTAASVVDWAVFFKTAGSWYKRSTTSNIAGAAVDSIVFPALAFGVLMPNIVAMQFVAKVAGGAVWGLLISKFLAAGAAPKVLTIQTGELEEWWKSGNEDYQTLEAIVLRIAAQAAPTKEQT